MSAAVTACISILLIMASMDAGEPTISVQCEGQYVPGDTVEMTVIVSNTTGYPLSDGIVYIDLSQMDSTLRTHVGDTFGGHMLPELLASGESDSVILTLEIRTETPDGTYEIPITFEGSVGDCEGGCFPFSITEFCTARVERKLPDLHYNIEPSYDVVSDSEISLPLTFSNRGDGPARNIRVSLSGDLECTLSPETFDMLEDGAEESTTLYLDTKGIGPGFYSQTFNVLYYDEYFRLYNEQVEFMFQARPLQPLLSSSLLCQNSCTLLEIVNEGGLKAFDVTYMITCCGNVVQKETIDELKTGGSVLAPVCFDAADSGKVAVAMNIEYFSFDGTRYFEDKEIFLNISKNTTSSNTLYYFIVAAALLVALAFVGRKRWLTKK